MIKTVVMRIGHRPKRDVRITTHVALVARAFGAGGFVLQGSDTGLRSVSDLAERWGGIGEFSMRSTDDPKGFIRKWKKDKGVVVHLTMYGINIEDAAGLREVSTPMLIVVGAGKVERWYYDNADYNIAIGNQPHSEVAAIAILLDRLYDGKELGKGFGGARLRIIGMDRGKKVVKA